MGSNYLWDSWIYCAQALGFINNEQYMRISQSSQQNINSMLSQQQWLIVRPIALEWLLGQNALQQGLITQEQLESVFQRSVQNAQMGKNPQFFLLADNHISQQQWEQITSNLDPILQQEYQSICSYIFSTSGTSSPAAKETKKAPDTASPSAIFKEEANDLESLLKGSQEEIPSQFGRYEILKELGRGGMGKVYHAKDPKLNREVALKVMIAGEQASPEMIQRFLQEAEATAKLVHANIIQLYDIGIEGSVSYFTMAYVKGETLSDLSKAGKITQRKAVQIMIKVAKALAEAHKHKIIHRDLKPANVMVDEKGEPKVMDFGLAKMVESDTELSRTGAVMGTPAYMPPEQAQGELKKIDARSDVYSLGAIFYVLLTRKILFEGDNTINIILQVIEKDPIAPRVLNPDIHMDLEVICLKCLEKNPQKRYQSANALARDLQNFLENKPISARPPKPIEKAVKWCRRHPLATSFIGAIIVMVLLVLGSLYYIIGKNIELEIAKKEATKEAKEAKKERDRANIERDRANAERDRANAESKRANAESKRANIKVVKEKLDAAKNFIEKDQLFDKAAYRIVEAHDTLSNIKGEEVKKFLEQMRMYIQYSILPNLPSQIEEHSFPSRWITSLTQETGKSILAVHNGGTRVSLWRNIEQMPYECTFKNAYHKFYSLSPISLSADGKYLATRTKKNLVIYDTNYTLSEEKPFLSIAEPNVSYVTISPNSKWLAAKGKNKLHLFNIPQKKLYSLTIDTSTYKENINRPYPIIFSRKSEYVVCGDKKVLAIWNVKTRKKIKEFSMVGQHSITTLALSPNNRFLIYGNKRGKLFIWDNKKDSPFPFAPREHKGVIKDILFSHNGRFFATASTQGKLILWDAWTQKPIFKRFFPGSVLEMSFDLQDRHLTAMVWRDKKILFLIKLKIEPNKVFQPLILPQEAQTLFDNMKKGIHLDAIVNPPLVISPSGRFVAFAMPIPKAVVWDRKKNTTKILTPTLSPTGWMRYKEVNKIKFSSDEKKLAIGYSKNGWVIWDTNTWKKISALPNFRSVAFASNNRSIFYIDHPANVVKKYDLLTKRWKKIHTYETKITNFKVSPSGKQIAIATGMYSEIFVLKNNTLTKTGRVEVGAFIDDFRWDHSEKRIAAGSRDGSFFIWEFANAQWQLIHRAHLGEYIKKVSFSPNGKKLAIFSQSNVTIFDIEHAQQTEAAIGYFKGGVVAFSSDWKYMVLPSFAGGFLLYDLQKNKGLVDLPPQKFKKAIAKLIGRGQK